MKPEHRAFILGLIAGITIGAGWIAPFIVDMVADRVIQKMTIPADDEADNGVEHESKAEPSAVVFPVKPIKNHKVRLLDQPLNLSPEDKYCLAKNVFHEAGVEPMEGKLAVAQVTINRLKSGRWGNTICKVVYAKAQFSWTLDKRKRKEVPKGPLWEESKQAVRIFLKGDRLPTLTKSLFYHTDYIKQPRWASEDYKIAQIGQHIFYTQDKKK